MPKFPRKEVDIAALATTVGKGLTNEAKVFPAPPVPPAELRALLAEFEKQRFAANDADARAKQAHTAKDEAQRQLVNALKSDLKYAEAVTRLEPRTLVALGWGPPRSRHALEIPGQVLNIRITSEVRDSIGLAWDPPFDGGKVAAYQVQRRNRGGQWENVGSTTAREHTLKNQPHGVALEYQVHAINRAGAGTPSGTVEAVL